MSIKKPLALLLLFLVLAGFSSCRQQTSQEEYYQRLADVFTQSGFPCTVKSLPSDTSVGLYLPSAWRALVMEQGTVLAYFDESNRADYLETFIAADQFGYVTHYGQRYVLTYAGDDSALLKFLETL